MCVCLEVVVGGGGGEGDTTTETRIHQQGPASNGLITRKQNSSVCTRRSLTAGRLDGSSTTRGHHRNNKHLSRG